MFVFRKIPKLEDWVLFVKPGFNLFLNQFFFITGLKLANVVTASAWQPSQLGGEHTNHKNRKSGLFFSHIFASEHIFVFLEK